MMIEAISTLTSANLTRSPAWQASFSIDGKYLAVCFGNPNTHVKIWQCCKKRRSSSDGDTNKEEEEWKLLATITQDSGGHTRSIRSVAFAPTSISYDVVPILATASFDGKVLIWEYCNDEDDDTMQEKNNKEDTDHDNISSNSITNNDQSSSYFEAIAQLEGHDNEIKDLAWNTTGSLLASCGRDKTIWIWECFLPGTIGGVESSSNNMDDGEAFECLAVLQGHDGDIKSIAFGPSHNQWGEGEEILISASYDNTIKVWAEEAGDWYCAMTLGEDNTVPRSVPSSSSSGGIVHTSTVWCVGFAPGGVRFFSGSDDGSMVIWKLYTATERKKLFPNEQVVSSTDGLWKCVGRLPGAHSSYAVFSIDCAPTRAGHGRIASAGGDNSINIYREESVAASGNGTSDAPKFSLEDVAVDAHDGDVNCIKWHPRDGRCLVSCGDDGAVKLWRYIR
jgi:WD40 repeat protein